MKFKIRIAESQDFSQDVIDYLKTFAQVEVKACTPEDLPDILKNYDVFWFRLAYKLDSSFFYSNMRCKIIATPVTGIDHIDEKACEKNNVKIISLKGENEFLKEVRATAELTIALTFALLRNVVAAANDAREGNWQRDLFRGNEIYKKTVGIIGLGRLGVITSEYFHALGAKVIGYDIQLSNISGFVKVENSIEEVIEKADIVSIHVNYSDKTHHLISKDVFKFFNNKKWLINTSRGGVIDEIALLNALKENRIAGAALDVITDEYSFNKENPLVQYASENKNLLIVPHIGGNTYESFEKTEWFIANKIIEEIRTWQY